MKTDRRPLLSPQRYRQGGVNQIQDLRRRFGDIERARVVFPATLPTTPNKRVTNQTPVTPPAAATGCDDFENGLGLWTFSTLGTAAYSLSTTFVNSPTHSLQADVGDAIGTDQVLWSRTDVMVDSGPAFMHFWFYVASGAGDDELLATVTFDGRNFWSITIMGSAGHELLLNTGSGQIATGLFYASGNNDVIIRFNEATGLYGVVSLNGGDFDASAYPALNAGGQTWTYQFLVEQDGGAVFTSWWDDICIGSGSP